MENQLKGYTQYLCFSHLLLSRLCIFITRHRYYSCDDFSYHLSPRGSNSMFCVYDFSSTYNQWHQQPPFTASFFFLQPFVCPIHTYARTWVSAAAAADVASGGGHTVEWEEVWDCVSAQVVFIIIVFFFPDETPTIDTSIYPATI